MSEIAELIKCLPLILGLLRAIQKGIEEAKTEETVADHLKAVTDAFNSKDASKLNAVFNNSTSPGV